MELLSAREDVPIGLVLANGQGRQLSALETVLEHSRRLSLTRYDKPAFHEEAYKDAIRQIRGAPRLSSRQEAVFAGKQRHISVCVCVCGYLCCKW